MQAFNTFDEDSLFPSEVSDEALETEGNCELGGSYALGSCTGLSVCPGWSEDRPTPELEPSMSNAFLNRTSRVAVAGRIAELTRPERWEELMIPGDYYLSVGKAEAQARAARWLWSVIC